jgi:short-chain 2-methylacyl-CoA dehydrogenase
MNSIYFKSHHHQLIEKVRHFAKSRIEPIAGELDHKEEFSVELTLEMGKLGLFGMFLPGQYGGQDMDFFSLVLAVEEIAKVDSSQASTVAAHNALGIGPIWLFGTEQQKQKYLPQLCTGEKIWAFGLTEANAGSDSRGTETSAVLENDKWVINGSKIFISNASSPASAGVTIQAVTGNNNGKPELTTFLVERESAGYNSERIMGKLMWRASDTAKLFFRDCRVPKENILGEPGNGAKITLKSLDSGRLLIGAIGLGLAQGAFDLAKDYAKKRIQFGSPISKFQGISFKLADMATKIESARQLLYHACWLKDNGHEFGKESAMAKLYCSEVARDVADQAVQIHGAYGLIKDNPVERFYRDQRLLQVGEGTSEIIRMVIARHIGC